MRGALVAAVAVAFVFTAAWFDATESDPVAWQVVLAIVGFVSCAMLTWFVLGGFLRVARERWRPRRR